MQASLLSDAYAYGFLGFYNTEINFMIRKLLMLTSSIFVCIIALSAIYIVHIQTHPRMSHPQVVPINECEQKVFFNIYGLTPHSEVTVYVSYSATLCTGEYKTKQWTKPLKGHVDEKGYFGTILLQEGKGTYHYTFIDSHQSISTDIVTAP